MNFVHCGFFLFTDDHIVARMNSPSIRVQNKVQRIGNLLKRIILLSIVNHFLMLFSPSKDIQKVLY